MTVEQLRKDEDNNDIYIGNTSLENALVGALEKLGLAGNIRDLLGAAREREAEAERLAHEEREAARPRCPGSTPPDANGTRWPCVYPPGHRDRNPGLPNPCYNREFVLEPLPA